MAEVEKGSIERVETLSDNDSFAQQKHNPLEKIETIQAVDVENHQAFKGDNSDGKVFWTAKKLLAAAFLSMLYTGACSNLVNANIQMLTSRIRLTAPAVLLWRYSDLHIRRSQRERCNWLAAGSQHSRHCIRLSFRRILARFVRKTIHCSLWRLATMSWLRSTGHCP